ncbi:tol-pal system protein YbgF [Pontibaca salina]|uniref:Cell division coordinator CpoB n=1 Tax=Pontibaca salina TaxID=2795731 RepID=A0A934HPJ5_9RHOB|nr:tol-pal system protein YbgF [Pontibaca salina]MBI6628611.1 tol-pal system protein YbgF [Pontibaca salina]
MRIAGFALIAALAFVPLPLAAQDKQTLADIRQELTILNVEMKRLQRELSTTGNTSLNLEGSGVLERVAVMETELQRLTALTENLENRINQVVRDGTNRIGDLEFRLVELEGGDISALGETSTLGGGDLEGPQAPAAGQIGTPSDAAPSSELAVGEENDFKAAQAALEAGDNQKAAELLADFNANYPGSPLAAQANLTHGKALDAIGDTREAARAYLAAFTAAPDGPKAPDALYELGVALGRLDQVSQACVTLAEVGIRFPDASAVSQARDEMARLGCS